MIQFDYDNLFNQRAFVSEPSASPVNVKGQNASSTSILVEWGEVPSADQNGVILTYNVSYQSLTQNDVGNKVVGYPANQTELTGLKKFVNYSITVLASTLKGSGKTSDPIFVITDQDSKWYFPFFDSVVRSNSDPSKL